jgi:DNA primase
LAIPEDIINQIKERADIADVIGEYVPLKKAGKNYKGLCPFHTEKTPSFMVSPQKGIFHCFGCGAGGNVYSFIMQFKGLSFPEAVRFLGDRVGIQIRDSETRRQGDNRVALLREVNAAAARCYRENLLSPDGKRALDYLRRRNISDDGMNTFGIGFALDSWDSILRRLRGKGYGPEILVEAGLVVGRKSGRGHYDRFRNRIMFPILDSLGRCIGFGGRTLAAHDMDIPKYINSSENPVFQKGKTLYGFTQAEESIRKRDHAYIVEGYIDVIRMHEVELKNTVAPLGTALTEEHVALLSRYTRNMYLIFDPDEAGVRAALRSISIMHRRGIDPSVVRFPAGRDPGDFFDTYGLEDFDTLKNEALPGIAFIVKQHTTTKKAYTAHEKISILESLSEYYENMKDEIFREDFIKRLSESLGTETGVLTREITQRQRRRPTVSGVAPEKFDAQRGIHTELYLLLLILSYPEYLKLAQPRLDEGYFHGKWTKRLWRAINQAAQVGSWDSATVLSYIEDQQFVKYLSARLVDEALVHNPKEQLVDTIATLKEYRLREKLEVINGQLRRAELEKDETRETDLLVEKNALTNELKKIEQLRANKVQLG